MKRLALRRGLWFRTTVVAALAIFVGWAALALGGSTPADASPVTLATFTAVGYHTWTVPAGVTKITITAHGASGGNVTETLPGPIIELLHSGGAGGTAVATFKVKPGETFQILVGGHGASTNGQRGGGYGFPDGGDGATAPAGELGGAGGGGESDVRIGGTGDSCSKQTGYVCGEYDRILVAGGGGGAGENSDGGVGGGVTGGCGDTTPCTGTQEPQYEGSGASCVFFPNVANLVEDGCFYYGGTAASNTGQGGGGGGWIGGNHGYDGDLGGGGGGSGYISPLALKGSFPAAATIGDGSVVITTP